MTPAELCKEIYGVEPLHVWHYGNVFPSTDSVCVDDLYARKQSLYYCTIWRGSTCYALNCALVDGTFYYSQVVEVTT